MDRSFLLILVQPIILAYFGLKYKQPGKHSPKRERERIWYPWTDLKQNIC